ncbi:DUF6292 family protein [Amycolatopsis sp. lyj-90]|uniref:DUF6292 family protein n=1 Tax=Amycolatopsis sp. lyj-90 TaxID=2789285 RepID=UPI0039780D00
MTASLTHPHLTAPALWAYLAEVSDALGIGLESCTVDYDSPVSAYIALDVRLRNHPERDVALLWDELGGWALATETQAGNDLSVVRRLGGDSPLPSPARVAHFVRSTAG